MIPAEAVEAAAKAIWNNARIEPWEDAHWYLTEEYRNDARIALEAAAPHIRAQALECAADQLDRELSETRQAQEKPWEWLAGIADAEQALRAYAARYTLNTDGDE